MTKFTRFKMLLMALVMLVGSGNVWGQTASVTLRPSHIDISSATSESAVLVTLSSYSSNDARYRLYNGSNQYNPWNESTDAYVSSTSYGSGPLVLGTPTSSSTFWILFQRGNNATTAATYRDRLGTAYSANYQTVALPAATSITTSFALSGTFNGTIDFDRSVKHVALAYSGSTLISAASTSLTTGLFSIVCPNGTTIDKIEIRSVTNTIITSLTGSWSSATNVGNIPVLANPTVSTPTISISGVAKTTDVYFNTAEVTLSTTTEGASIYYTDNGDTPTSGSILYSGPFNVTSTKTIKAIAVKADMDNSIVASKTITIVAPATATVPYTEAFNNTLGDWYNYEVSGTKPWTTSANGAYCNGYVNPSAAIESWLISPKFTADGSGLNISFNYASKYVGNSLLVKVSSDYQGYGSPAAATWTTLATILAPTVQDDAYTVKYSGNLLHSTAGNVHFALVYATSANYSDWRITNVNVAVPTATPSILVTESTVPAMTAFTGGTDTETITVNGSNLTADIGLAVTGTDASLFSLSTNSIAQTDGTVSNVVVTITYTPVSAGSHSATLTLSSTGAESVVKSLSGTATVPPTAPDVIITEVYGGGGNSGATYTNDYIELYNTTESSVQVGGWSIQYFSAATTGLASNIITIPAGKYIPAKSHFLIQGASGGAVGSALTTPDATGTVNASGSAGKIILYTTDAAQTISDIASITGNAYFKDYLPYGTTAVPVWGSAMGSNASNTTSAARKVVSGEYLYSQIIGSDFEVATPSPESTGLTTSVDNPLNNSVITAFDGKIRFSATAGQQVEVYNAVGQKLMSATTLDGLNTLNVNAKGMMIVKVGDRLAKVIL